ncbi:hypothetical protein AB205_0030030 [Aquarana catesbeiana]|uniref:Uncharacterized protein n=1 Tax=Aquarana catesbeiana TaxID=8400 RepID=A0A2G9R3Q3_AQUCT|nr:hypothetical protein AB205_0030030 [Aquarana catesbeiana]
MGQMSRGVQCFGRGERRYIGGVDEQVGTVVGQMCRGLQWWSRCAGGYSGGADVQGVTVVEQMSRGASLFAESMGFVCEDLTTNRSLSIYSKWLDQHCQPNFRTATQISFLPLGIHFFYAGSLLNPQLTPLSVFNEVQFTSFAVIPTRQSTQECMTPAIVT